MLKIKLLLPPLKRDINVCGNCGATLVKGLVFCPTCG